MSESINQLPENQPKTDEQVAQQIGRIADKLITRVDDLNAENSYDNEANAGSAQSNLRDHEDKPGEGYRSIEVKREASDGSSIETSLSRTERIPVYYGLGKTAKVNGRLKNSVGVQAFVYPEGAKRPTSRDFYGVANLEGEPMHVGMSRKQSIQTSAKILSEIRSATSHEKDKAKKQQAKLDDLLSA